VPAPSVVSALRPSSAEHLAVLAAVPDPWLPVLWLAVLVLWISPVVAAASVAQNLGKFISVVIPQPALGAGAATVKVPAGFQWRVKGCKATLTTGATAGNRNVAVQCSDAAGNQMSQAFSSYVHPKSTAVAYTFGPGLLNTTTAIFFAMSSTMCEMDLGPGASFQVAVVGIQATDQLSLITLMVESIAVS